MNLHTWQTILIMWASTNSKWNETPGSYLHCFPFFKCLYAIRQQQSTQLFVLFNSTTQSSVVLSVAEVSAFPRHKNKNVKKTVALKCVPNECPGWFPELMSCTSLSNSPNFEAVGICLSEVERHSGAVQQLSGLACQSCDDIIQWKQMIQLRREKKASNRPQLISSSWQNWSRGSQIYNPDWIVYHTGGKIHVR